MSWSRNFLNYLVLRKLFFPGRFLSLHLRRPFLAPLLALCVPPSLSLFLFLFSLSLSLFLSLFLTFHPPCSFSLSMFSHPRGSVGKIRARFNIHVWSARRYFSDHYFRPFLPFRPIFSLQPLAERPVASLRNADERTVGYPARAYRVL